MTHKIQLRRARKREEREAVVAREGARVKPIMLDPNLTKRKLYVYKLYDRCSVKTGEIIESLYYYVSLPLLNHKKYNYYRHLLNSSREYRQWRLYCLTRDDYVCQCCDDNVATQVHHIIEVKTNPRLALDPTNGISLCSECHALQHPWL